MCLDSLTSQPNFSDALLSRPASIYEFTVTLIMSHAHPIASKDHYDGIMQNHLEKTVTLSSEQFEKLYLGPKTQVAGDLRKRFANPTPIALLGFSVGLLPLSIAFST